MLAVDQLAGTLKLDVGGDCLPVLQVLNVRIHLTFLVVLNLFFTVRAPEMRQLMTLDFLMHHTLVANLADNHDFVQLISERLWHSPEVSPCLARAVGAPHP